jgi:hypothetical protein
MTVMQHIPEMVTAIGGLGVAAAGLVDASKVSYGGGVNRIGFSTIRDRIKQFVPDETTNAMGLADVLDSLQENWFNGTDLASQKAIAKSLIKLNFNPDSANKMAIAASVDATILKTVAENIAQGTALTQPQNDVYARFDLILTALLDATFQRADQRYRNGARCWAIVASVLLAIAGASILANLVPWKLEPDKFWQAVIVGLLATPLAPIAKDLSTALATAVNTMQLVKK